MTGITDYGVGNLFSLLSSLKRLGIRAEVSSDSGFLSDCDRVILPGVGAFGDAMKKLETSGLDGTLAAICARGTPVLGICLGMQLLFDRSFEYGEHVGLGLISGEVVPLERRAGLKIPHMGWNGLEISEPSCPILKYVDDGEYVYFVHSYKAAGCEKNLAAVSYYGQSVAAVVQSGNLFGTQFHPEKSGDAGLRILKAFCEV